MIEITDSLGVLRRVWPLSELAARHVGKTFVGSHLVQHPFRKYNLLSTETLNKKRWLISLSLSYTHIHTSQSTSEEKSPRFESMLRAIDSVFASHITLVYLQSYRNIMCGLTVFMWIMWLFKMPIWILWCGLQNYSCVMFLRVHFHARSREWVWKAGSVSKVKSMKIFCRSPQPDSCTKCPHSQVHKIRTTLYPELIGDSESRAGFLFFIFFIPLLSFSVVWL